MANIVEKCCDYLYSKDCKKTVPMNALMDAKLIAHRGGDYDNKEYFENTIEVMNRSLKSGVWGIEFDVRWTRDLMPVVFHDASLKRLYDLPHKIKDLMFTELFEIAPKVPTLQQVVEMFGKKLHLMIEIKSEKYTHRSAQNYLLKQYLRKLDAGKDYHIISIDPKFLKNIQFIFPNYFLSVGMLNTKKMSQYAIDNRFAGTASWYPLLKKEMIDLHHKRNQHVGTGWISNIDLMKREICRGVDWFFSKNAIELRSEIIHKYGMSMEPYYDYKERSLK